jgi:NAD(P)-dependent dehydrogenase (short-subunit alcohol dehydrogenase family)
MTSSPRVALVTGASAGLGRACADRLAAAGWVVVGASRRGTGGTGGTKGIGGIGGTSGTGGTGWAGLIMDVDRDDAVRDGVAGVLKEHGRIDALVAAAGWGVAGAAEDTSISEARAQFETNFWGCVRVVRAVLPQMRERGGGRIVLLSSIGGVIGIPFQAYYSATKFALEGFAESLAYEVAPFGVAVTLVQPGNFATDFTASRKVAVAATPDSAYAAAMAKAIAVMERDERNGASPGQVAAAVQRVLEARKPPRRVSVGKAGERVGIIAKRLLPFRVFEAAAKGSLGVE